MIKSARESGQRGVHPGSRSFQGWGFQSTGYARE
jgi:hypothetical protein